MKEPNGLDQLATWTVSKENPGYREKVVRQGNCNIIILRPLLIQEEQTKREQKAKAEIERGLRDYLLRKEVHR
jgi:hypothetical protein